MNLRKLFKYLQSQGLLDPQTGATADQQMVKLAMLMEQDPLVRKLVLKYVRMEARERSRMAQFRKLRKEEDDSNPDRPRIFRPFAGRIRKLRVAHQDRNAPAYRLFLTTRSRKKSGTQTATLMDIEGTESISYSGDQGSISVSGTIWNTSTGTQITDVGPEITYEQFISRVLLNSYIGDLQQLTFHNLRVVSSSAPTSYEVALPNGSVTILLEQGLNLVGLVELPEGFHHLMGRGLVLFGRFSDKVETRSADLRTAPLFDITLEGIPVKNCFLNLATYLDPETEAWATYAYVNGSLEIFEEVLPLTAALSTDMGLLSFNLDTEAGPAVPVDGFKGLAPVVNSENFLKSWDIDARTFFGKFKTYNLNKLNLIYNVGTRQGVSLGLGIVFGEEYKFSCSLGGDSTLAVALKDVSVEWLIGIHAEHAFTSYGAAAEARIARFGYVPWECSFQSWPRFSISCMADAKDLPASTVAEFISALGGTPPVIGEYAGCYFNFYKDGFELFVMDALGDAQQVRGG